MFGNFQYLIPIFGMGFVSYMMFLKYKENQEINKERIALIEKGLDPSLLDSKPKNQQSNLKIGLILISIAVGVLFGYMLNSLFYVPNFVAYPTSILVFCGMLLVYIHKSKIE